MATPAWSAASAGSTAQAGQINQFLGTHAATYVYNGTSQVAQTTAAAGNPSDNTGTFAIAESFTTGASQTSVSRVELYLGTIGTGADVTISLQTNAAGHPSGTPLVSTLLPVEFILGGWQSIPLPTLAVSAATLYWVVMSQGGTGSNYVTWGKSNQASGAQTDSGGTWTAQAYGYQYNVYTGYTGALRHAWADSGARWTDMTHNPSAPFNIDTIKEYTGALRSVRTISYNGTLPVSVT